MPGESDKHESLFSYGTLRFKAIQRSTFGRALRGSADSLLGFEHSMVRIEDPTIVKSSGMTHHTVVKFTGRALDEVKGTVFQITADQLQNADEYEVSIPAATTKPEKMPTRLSAT